MEMNSLLLYYLLFYYTIFSIIMEIYHGITLSSLLIVFIGIGWHEYILYISINKLTFTNV